MRERMGLDGATGSPQRSGVEWPLLLTILLALCVVLVRALGSSAWDLGDGALHYLQARHAPSNVHYFFDRWAKPTYVLLGTAFAQVGPIGLVVFNAIIAVLTTWGILSMLASAPRILQFLVPVLLFTSIQYFRVMVSGLTEPLFGLLTIACLWLLWNERYTLALLVLSFAPWTRPEYLVFAPLVIAWVVYMRKWTALPWALVGSALYFILGWILLKERIWHFVKDPYEGGADFGSGPIWHFLYHAQDVLGLLLLVFACLALPMLVALVLRDRAGRPRHLFILFLAAAPVLGIWAAHSYAYWAGGHASGGLLRVLATATPLTVLFVAYTCACHFRAAAPRYAWVPIAVVMMMAARSVHELKVALQLPAKATVEQQLVERAARLTVERLQDGSKVYSMHPYFALAAGLDIGDTTRNGRTWELDMERLRPGDLVEWDPHYGPENSGELLQQLLGDERMALISMDQESEGPWEAPFGVWLFERSTLPQPWRSDTVIDQHQGRGAEHILWKGNGQEPLGEPPILRTEGGEYPLDLLALRACACNEVLNEWVLEADLVAPDAPDDARFIWVFTTMEDVRPTLTLEHKTGKGRFTARFQQGGRLSAGEMRIYLWNIDRHAVRIDDLRLVRRSAGVAGEGAPLGHRP